MLNADNVLTIEEFEEPIVFLSEHPAVEEAIRGGATLHAFSSGGGLRVFRVEAGSKSPGKRGNKLLAYGEHPYAEIALRHTEEDCQAGGRKYDDVYGKGKSYTHYLTGASEPNGVIDRYLRIGRSFDIYFKRRGKGSFVFSSTYLYDRPWPRNAAHLVLTTWTPYTWTANGVTYEMSPFVFPGNGEKSTSLRVLSNTNQKRSRGCMFDRRVYFTARTFSQLLKKMEKELAKTFKGDW